LVQGLKSLKIKFWGFWFDGSVVLIINTIRQTFYSYLYNKSTTIQQSTLSKSQYLCFWSILFWFIFLLDLFCHDIIHLGRYKCNMYNMTLWCIIITTTNTNNNIATYNPWLMNYHRIDTIQYSVVSTTN
jgi:hypothetical protein